MTPARVGARSGMRGATEKTRAVSFRVRPRALANSVAYGPMHCVAEGGGDLIYLGDSLNIIRTPVECTPYIELLIGETQFSRVII